MKRFYILFTFLCCLLVQQTFAQVRYVDQVFTDDQIMVERNVPYGVNMDFFPVIFLGGQPTPKDLVMDIYMPDPAVDDVENRPVIVMVANTLQPRFVQDCFGDKDDLQHTTIAPKLAKTGYVVVLVNMRQGWNPLVTQPNDFLTQLADGAIRQIQDLHSASRFLQKQIIEGGNPWGMDSEKMISWGISNGASTVIIAAMYGQRDEEYETPAYIAIDQESGEAENIYDRELFGNVSGTEPGFTSDGLVANLPANNGCYNINFKMAVTSGAISLDTVLMEAGEPPMINFVAQNWATTPFEFAPLNLPIGGEFCCLVYPAHTIVRLNDELGNNDAWKGVEFKDPIANTRGPYGPDTTRSIEGIYNITTGNPAVSYPWIWFDEELCQNVDTNQDGMVNEDDLGVYNRTRDGLPGNSLEQMNSIHDEMIAYALPRACITLGLGCATEVTTGLQEPLVESQRIAVAPNPSSGDFVFTTAPEHTMETISIYNISGSLMFQTEVHNNQFSTINLDLANGMYIAKIKFEDGVASKKLMVGE